jgi:hypothetical protein
MGSCQSVVVVGWASPINAFFLGRRDGRAPKRNRLRSVVVAKAHGFAPARVAPVRNLSYLETTPTRRSMVGVHRERVHGAMTLSSSAAAWHSKARREGLEQCRLEQVLTTVQARVSHALKP